MIELIKNKQDGLYTVEFAIVGSLFFLLFFAAIEISRVLFTWNVLTEVSRRGARLATVCPIIPNGKDDSSVANAASFSENMLPNLTMDNISISYFHFEGNEITASTNYNQIRLVRVEIIDYQHELLIPGFFLTLNSPNFSTTLPRESLGATREGDSDCS